MPHEDRLKFQLWTRSPEYHRLLSETRSRLDAWARQYHQPYIAYSGGKDSTALLHLVLTHWPPKSVVVWHWDYGPWLMPRPYEREAVKNAEQIIGESGAELSVYHRPGGPEARTDSRTGYRAFFATLQRMATESRRDVGISGLRAAESITRRRRTRTYSERDSATGLELLFPLADWRAGDVWAYLVSNNLPHHSLYDRYARLLNGYESETTRFVTFFDGEMDKFGSPSVDGVLSWRYRDSPE